MWKLTVRIYDTVNVYAFHHCYYAMKLAEDLQRMNQKIKLNCKYEV